MIPRNRAQLATAIRNDPALRQFIVDGTLREEGVRVWDPERILFDGKPAVTHDPTLAHIMALLQSRLGGMAVNIANLHCTEEAARPRLMLVLAMGAKFGNAATRRCVYRLLPEAAPAPRHVGQFLAFRIAMGGVGREIKAAVRNWFACRNKSTKSVDTSNAL